MLLGIKTKKELLFRHLLIGIGAFLLVYIFWLLRPDILGNQRLWRSLGDSSYVLLFLTLAIGPLAKLKQSFQKIIAWRRETGIWFSILSIFHFVLVLDFALNEPGIELAMMLGYIGLVWGIVLMLTSSDWAVNIIGISSWKWLHSMAYVIFYAASSHAAYFLFWRYPNTHWFQYLFLFMAISIIVLQASAFVKEVLRQKSSIKTTRRIISLPIISQREIAKGTYEISFDNSKENLEFVAGQYIKVYVPKLLYPDDRGNQRMFSICSSPNNKGKISITFRNSGSGFKKSLIELPVGSMIQIEGPFGSFTLPSETEDPIVLIAGGIGITPILSMIRFANERITKHMITLLYGNKDEESSAYLKELTKIADENKKISLKNKFGLINEDFIKENIKDNARWYIVGSPAMVNSTRNILSKLGINNQNVYFEEFSGY